MQAFIGLDVGTSAIKGVLITEDGHQVARAVRPVEFIRPKPGYVEIVPDDHYRSVCEIINELISKLSPGASVKALSMAFASGNMLMLDGAYQPLTNIISWLDKRSLGMTPDLLPDLDTEQFHHIVGWNWTELFPLSQFAWHRKFAPDTYQKACRFCMNSDYLMFRLTGEWGIDPSTASTIFLQDQMAMAWHPSYLGALGIAEKTLSRIMPSGAVLGKLTDEAAAETGLGRDTLVVLGAFDHPCAARGTGCFATGSMLLSCGTSWVGFYPIEDRELAISQRLLVDPFLKPSGPWGAMFALTAVAVEVDWYIENLISSKASAAEKYSDFNQAALESNPGAGGLRINPFQRSPEKLASLNTRSERANLARALMEGAAFEMRRKIEMLAEAGIGAHNLTMVGGPTNSPIWPRIVAQIVGLELKLINGQTAGAVGAAVLAAVGAGRFRNEEQALLALGGSANIIEPDGPCGDKYESLYRAYLAEYPSAAAKTR